MINREQLVEAMAQGIATARMKAEHPEAAHLMVGEATTCSQDERDAEAALLAQSKAGCAVVPVEATTEMLEGFGHHQFRMATNYSAMLQAGDLTKAAS